MNKKTSLVISLIVGVVLFILVYLKTGFLEILETFSHASLIKLSLYLLISILIIFFLVLRWKFIIRAHGFDVPLYRLVMYKLSGYAISYITPSAHIGGEPVRAYLLKRDRVPFSKGLSTVIVDKSFDLTVNAFFGLLGVILVLVNIALPSNTLIILTVLSIVAFSFIFSFYFQLMKGKGFFTKLFRILRLHKAKLLKDHEKKLEEIEREVIHFFTNNRKDFITAFLISLLLWFLMFMEYKVVLLIFGYDASPVDIFLAFFMVGVAYIVPIPGALGVLEFGETSLFSVIATKGVGFAMSLIIRAKDIILTCIGLLFLFYFHIKLKDIPKK